MTSTRNRSSREPTVGSSPVPSRHSPRLWPAIGAVITAVVLFFAIGGLSGDRLAENLPPDTEGRAGPTPTSAPLLPAAPQSTWQLAQYPLEDLIPDSLIWGDHGFTAISRPGEGPAALLWSRYGLRWSAAQLDFTPRGVTPAGDELVAYRDAMAWSFTAQDGHWVDPQPIELPVLVRRGYLSRLPGLTFFGGYLLLQSPEGELYARSAEGSAEVVVPVGVWSRELRDPWEAATSPLGPDVCRPPRAGSPDYVPFVESPPGLLALVSGGGERPHGVWPVCEPAIWTTSDGLVWERRTESSPFQPGAYVYDAAARNGRLIAVGGIGAERPAMWESADGLEWRRRVTLDIANFASYQPTQIASGPAGWIILGTKPNAPQTSAWISLDGECWERVPDEIEAHGVAVGDLYIVVAGHDGSVWAAQPRGSCS